MKLKVISTSECIWPQMTARRQTPLLFLGTSSKSLWSLEPNMKHVPPRRSSKPGRGFHAGTLRRARREPLAFCSYMFVPTMKGVASLQTGTDLSRAPPTTTTTTTLSLPVSSCIIMAHLNINQASSNGTKATKTHTHSCTCGCTHTHTHCSEHGTCII